LSWGWWLPGRKRSAEVHDVIFGPEQESNIPAVEDRLRDARSAVEMALNSLIQGDLTETHRYISEAHQNLREASRLLGFRPTKKMAEERLRLMRRYYEPL